jgi:IclR family acetate operon transcriptional repressor
MTEIEASGKQVIARAAVVLRCLAGQSSGLTLAQLVRASDLPRSTVVRIVQALQSQHLVAAIENRFALGPAITALAASTSLDFPAIARPHLEVLARSTRETVNLSVLRGGHAILIDQVPSDRELRVVSPIGSALPLHCTAHGKALLAAMSDDEVVRRMEGAITPRTKHSLRSLADILRQLSEIRTEEFAIDIEENLDGVCGVGAALRGSGPERYAVSLSVPTMRFGDVRERLIEALRTFVSEVQADVEA